MPYFPDRYIIIIFPVENQSSQVYLFRVTEWLGGRHASQIHHSILFFNYVPHSFLLQFIPHQSHLLE